MLQLFTANFLYGFNTFQMAVQFFKTASNFPNFDGPNAFSPQIQQAHGPNFRKVGISLVQNMTIYIVYFRCVKQQIDLSYVSQTFNLINMSDHFYGKFNWSEKG